MESWGAISPKTTSDKFDLEDLIDGTYTLIVTATDQAGNSSTASYTWTVDRTPPTVSITPDAASPAEGEKTTLNISLSSNEPVENYTYSYKLTKNGEQIGEGTGSGSSLTISQVPEGSNYRLDVKVDATDFATNTSKTSFPPLTFDLNRYVLTGSASGIGSVISGSATGDVAGVLNKDWGGWNIKMEGSYQGHSSGSWKIYAGGKGYDSPNDMLENNPNGYWLNILNESNTGESEFTYLTHKTLGEGGGKVTFLYKNGNTWEVTDIGNEYTETPLAFGGGVGSELFEWDPFFYLVGNRTLIGLMGGTESLWTGTSPFLSLGTYDTESLYNGALWGVDIGAEPSGFISDGGAFLGIMGGISLNDNLEGRALALYIKPNGEGYETGYILSDNVSGSLYPGIGMYELGGNLISVPMGTTSISPGNLSWDGFYGDSPSLYLGKEVGTVEGDVEGSIAMQNIGLVDEDWGIWWGSGGGTFNMEEPPSTDWTANASGESYGFVYGEEGAYWDQIGYWGGRTIGTEWANGVLKGLNLGYWANTLPATGISVGEILGTFDPNAYTWQAVSMGAWIETNKFLQMAATTEGQAKLQQMNIPCVEVGRATLTGSGNNFSSLNMTDTIFFAPNSGAKPTIWATGNVNGSYSSAPTINTPVGLSGGGLNADFTFKQWDAGNGKWLSSINGTGGFNGSASFQGAGAGTLTNPSGAGTISGTAAGVAR